MKIVDDLDRYIQFAAAQAMTIAAANPSGSAAIGMGLGAGAPSDRSWQPRSN